MIDKLTKEQEEDLIATRDLWLKIGRSSEPINREKVTGIINKFYQKVGRKNPEIVFLQSPLQCLLWYINKVCPNASKEKRKEAAVEQLGQFFAGAHWCAWEVRYDFARRIGVQYTEQENELLDLWLDQAREMNWWFPYEDYCLVSERPNIVKVDEEGRFHSLTGKALQYPDDVYGFYAIHGVVVPEKVVLNPESLTPEEILSEGNAEVRRVMMDQYGYKKLMEEVKAEVLDEDRDGLGPRKLIRLKLSGDEDVVMVQVQCVTKQGETEKFLLRVPPTTKTCREAVASTWGKKAEEYDPEFEA